MNHLLLIDSRVKDSELVIQSLLPNIDYVVINYQEDTFLNITSKIPTKRYSSVGIFQENYNTPNYQFLAAFGNSILENVESEDPMLDSWKDYIELLNYFKDILECSVVDLMGCCIFSDHNWNYVLDALAEKVGITLNSSVDNTGTESLDGNWILESSNLDLIGKYFTENIKKYKFILGLSYHSLFLSNGDVYSCGLNGYGQLGLGHTTNAPSPVKITTLSNITAVSSGTYHSLFLKNDGTVFSCGWNDYGQLGIGDTSLQYSPVLISSLSNVKSVSAGNSSSLFLKNDGTVWVCGWNEIGLLGVGNTSLQYSPVQITSLSNITAISNGDAYSFYLKNDGTVWCCGYNGFGQLGLGDTTDRTTPVQITSLSNITAISAGSTHALFLKNNGTVFSSGYNLYGQLGLGGYADRTTPVQITSLSNITAISSGAYHSLFLKNDMTVWSVGNNGAAQLGLGFRYTDQYTPVQIPNFGNVVSIYAGQFHSVFLKNDGTAWAVGYNNSGQLGIGNTTLQVSPVQVQITIVFSIYNYITNGYTPFQLRELGYTIANLKVAYQNKSVIYLSSFDFETNFPSFSAVTTLFSNNDNTISTIDLTAYTYNFKYIYLSSNGWIQLSNSTTAPSDTNNGTNSNIPTDVIRILSANLITSVNYTITTNYVYINYSGRFSSSSTQTLNINIAIDKYGIIVAKYVLSSDTNTVTAYVGVTGSTSSSSTDDVYLINNGQGLYNLLNNISAQFYTTISDSSLKAAGYTASDMRTDGKSASQMKAANYTATDLKSVGYSGTELKTGGYIAAEMKTAYTATDLRTIGYSASNMKAANYTADELKAAGYSASDMRSANYTVSQLKSIGYSDSDLKIGGYTTGEFEDAGYTEDQLTTLGFTSNDFLLSTLQTLKMFTVSPNSSTDVNSFINTNQSNVFNLQSTISQQIPQNYIDQGQIIIYYTNLYLKSSTKLDLLNYLKSVGIYVHVSSDESSIVSKLNNEQDKIAKVSKYLKSRT